MRNFIIGFIIGTMFMGIAWAAASATLVHGSGNAIGTTAVPLVVQGV